MRSHPDCSAIDATNLIPGAVRCPPNQRNGQIRPNWATSGNWTPGPVRKLTTPFSTAIKGVGIAVGMGVSVGIGVGVGATVKVGCPGPGETGGIPGVPPGKVGVSTAVGGVGITLFGSMPGGIIMTPGVPSCGGVTMTTETSVAGIEVKVGTSARRRQWRHRRASQRNSRRNSPRLTQAKQITPTKATGDDVTGNFSVYLTQSSQSCHYGFVFIDPAVVLAPVVSEKQAYSKANITEKDSEVRV